MFVTRSLSTEIRVIVWRTHSFEHGIKIDSVDGLLGSNTFASMASYALSGSNGLSPSGHWSKEQGGCGHLSDGC